MANDIAQLKQLQADLNAAFDSVFSIVEQEPKNASGLAASKSQLAHLALTTFGAILGPVPSILDFSFQPLAYMAVRVASDLQIFQHVSKPTSLDELVQKTSADPAILGRILRSVSSVGYLKQTGVRTWEPTPLSKAAAIPPVRDWLIKTFEPMMKVYGEFPQWLSKREYKSTGSDTTDDDCVFAAVHGMPHWKYLDTYPKESAIFDSSMKIQDAIPPEMRPPYPFDSQADEDRSEGEVVTMVDIGGGFGQAVQQIRAQYPNLKGRFIVQDLPKTIEQIDTVAGFEPMVHDFFAPQPIKGARYYHLRRVLHCWNDESAKKILRRVHEAMKDSPSYSRLLIYEFVLPEVGCEFREAMADMLMMVIHDGVERSEGHFNELLTSCGFKITKILKAEVGATAVIEAAVA